VAFGCRICYTLRTTKQPTGRNVKKPPLKLREGIWHLRRRVPKRYETVETRGEVTLSLHTDSYEAALGKWKGVWDNLVEGWEAKLAGDSNDAVRRHTAAVELAQLKGFRYLPMREVTQLGTMQLVERMEAATDAHEVKALSGTTPRPKITVTKLLEEYWPATRDKVLGKSKNQIRLWRNPRKKAVENFKLIVGDKAIDEITREDMLDFRQWWMERVAGEEGLKPGTANKDFTHLRGVWKKVNELKQLGIDMDSLLAGLSFAEGEQRTRPPFSSDWIRNRLLAPKALTGLNTEARCVVMMMVNTGARPSEITTLNESTIDLIGPVPHIKIRPDGRTVKSPRAKREIPLWGVSLEAAKECSNGFQRYFDKPGLSGTVNAYFSENELRQTPEHSFYSLRHSFEDRMLEVGIDYRIRKDLMGHRLNGERYGAGATLAQAAALLQPISF